MTTSNIVDDILSGDKAKVNDISTWTGYEPITTSSLFLELCCKFHIGTGEIFTSKEEAQLFQDFVLSGMSIEDFIDSYNLEKELFDTSIHHFLTKISSYILVLDITQQ